jgi:methionyl-tRNA formyltransferase
VSTLKILFAGTSDFAKAALETLINAGFNVIAVCTQPDKPAGRGQQLKMSSVKCFSLKHHIPVYQPATLRDQTVQHVLSDLNPDIMVVAAYGLLLPKAVLSIPALGCINIHGSLLPRWRGAAPIQRAILAGDEVTGITIMQMNEGMDTGDILLQSTYQLRVDETSATLFERLAQMGGEAIVSALRLIEKGELSAIPQDDNLACYATKIHKSEGFIDWENSAVQLDRAIRAFNPWPVAYSYLEGELVRIWRATPLFETAVRLPPGTIVAVTRDVIHVATGEGVLAISKLQFAGGKPLEVRDVLNSKPKKFIVGKLFHVLYE